MIYVVRTAPHPGVRPPFQTPEWLVKRALAILAATVGLTGSALVASPTSASADVPCSIDSFSPTGVVVGLTPVSRRMFVELSDCSGKAWELFIGDREFAAFSDDPLEVFAPRRDAQAGAKRVVVTASNDDFVETTRTWETGFSLKRRTAFRSGTFNASPEPARRGRPINLKGRLVIADWDHDRYVGARGRTVQVQFATPSGEYGTVKTVRADRDGWVRTTVTAQATGKWRLVYRGNATAGAAKTRGDAVEVR
jgi:hypothetical protein